MLFVTQQMKEIISTVDYCSNTKKEYVKPALISYLKSVNQVNPMFGMYN